MKIDYIPCKECNGQGVIVSTIHRVSTPDGPHEVYGEVDCKACKGSGEVKVHTF